MSTAHVATKPYTCDRCTGVIQEGAKYRRRPEFTGARFRTGRYHPECEKALIKEILESGTKGR